MLLTLFSVPSHCCLGIRKSIRPVKFEWWGVSMVISLEQLDIVCIWSCRCHCCLEPCCLLPCYNPEWFFPFWDHLMQLVLENRHTHIRLTTLCPGLPGWARTRKVQPIWILLKQEIASGSGISWAICNLQVCISRQITMPAPHHSPFLQAGRLSCRPTNSVKALLWH